MLEVFVDEGGENHALPDCDADCEGECWNSIEGFESDVYLTNLEEADLLEDDE